jgi:hypothetical protein
MNYLPGNPETAILLISASHVVWVIGLCYCAQLLVEMGSHELVAQAGLKLRSY